MPKLLQDLSFPAIMAGFITCMIGISVSAVLVIEAAQSLGANQAQISSWLWALGIGIGVSGFLLSWKYRYPISTAWSTAGLALVIASAGHYSLGEAICAFLISGVLIACLGFFGIFERIFQFIPQSLTSAMLAGVLLKFGISVFGSLQQSWEFVLCVLAIYLVSKKLSTRYSIVITVLMAIALCPFFINFTIPQLNWSIAQPVWTTPEFSLQAILGLALPLMVINLASQYLPGLAVIKSYGYPPKVNSILGWTGITQTMLAPFGCFSVNLAAISAAVSLDAQAHPDPAKRYIAGMSCGLFYILMGFFAATLTSLLMAFPAILITVLAGIALFGTIGHNIALAFQDSHDREAALMTFLFSASNIQFFGIGSAFWGLLLGLMVYLLFKLKPQVA
ncbi:benzoate/H(+) symporter BenE family transporter [Acinetobacter lwoffii]|uniref:benzoate/H(+) symporter BenE family transporter n=1 Tax=Acinetobacter lwoffii TaxID=28090 RepID=UPI001298690C|nr:benzoate/H(+) symporter BenE family transporter [Acinetobacter lwoffii]MDP1315600.1 benzoate/H(+) symporter BenE family transporter [Acinetobacter lwoffii]MRA02252.1 benzoate/H(+) symporter BenE family transporter [Acinetobacter lwoffii]